MATLADILRQTGYTPDGTTPTDSPMIKVLAEHIKSIPQKFAQNQQTQMDLLGKAFPGNTYESMMTQGDPKALAELAMQTPFNAMIAYHGTPHKIVGNFDINKVGTGEGAQAYGHGMYFAENPKVAAEYRDNLSDFDWSFSGKPYDINNPAHRAAIELKQLGGNVAKEETIKRYEKNIADLESRNVDWAKNAAQKKKEELAVLKTGVLPQLEETSKGNLYKVDIPDEYIPNMLDWDKPLNQQSAEVLKAIKIPQKAANRYNEISNKLEELQWTKGGLDSPEWNKLFEEAKDIKAKYGLHRSGEELYREAYKVAQESGAANPSQAAAESLKAQGIPGIRYLDEGSRIAPKYTGDMAFIHAGNSFKEHGYSLENAFRGMKEAYKNASEKELKDALGEVYGVKPNQTSNFVVFDPSTVKILEENSKPVSRKALIEEQVNKLKD